MSFKATVSLYASEHEVILHNAATAGETSWTRLGRSKGLLKGSLHGLWTHSGNVLVQLAIPASDPNRVSWRRFCSKQELCEVGQWGTDEPDTVTRPSRLESTVGYIYIRCLSDDTTKVRLK
ncbi:uncharacterized protein LOC134182631 [Corticium candelabrum]|uniref:uncharacterized protein LOC134182631 n=1 Tax=Corticium candelabrum TaxID=121492 RepID=UPI002E275A60|nr:uncharacterized protein LOC134182631 [Corticium candelabrum]